MSDQFWSVFVDLGERELLLLDRRHSPRLRSTKVDKLRTILGCSLWEDWESGNEELWWRGLVFVICGPP